MRLSKNFTLEEMTRSATAIRKRIPNNPNDAEVAHLAFLCLEVLQPLRDTLQQPIIVTSGFRSKQLNKAVGGVSNSYHLQGMAADILVTSEKIAELYSKILLKQAPTDVVIYERKGTSQWLHVQWSYKPRHKYLKIIK